MKTKVIAGAAALLLLCAVGCSNGSEVTDGTIDITPTPEPDVYKGKPWCSTNGSSMITYVWIDSSVESSKKAHGIRLYEDGTAQTQTATVSGSHYSFYYDEWQDLDYTAEEVEGSDPVITVRPQNSTAAGVSYTFTQDGTGKHLVTKTETGGFFKEPVATEFTED